MARLTNSAYPHLRAAWDEIYTETSLGNRYVADHVAGLTWDDLRAPAAGLNPPGAVSDPDFDTTTGHALFDDSATEALVVFFQFPHHYASGTQIRSHIHWIKEGTGTVVWQMQYKWYNVGAEWPGAYTSLNTTSVSPDYGEVSPAVDVHTISAFAAIDGTGKTISSMLEIRFGRLGGDASDTYTGDARFVELDVHYLSVGHGSEQEYSKVFGESDMAGA